MATNRLWDKDSAPPTTLRQPKTAVTSNRDTNKQHENIIDKSELNLDAPEWFPPNYVRTPTTSSTAAVSSIQSRLTQHKNPPHQQQSAGERRGEGYFNGDISSSPDILRVKQIINTLTNDPGQFDDLLHIFLETLYPYLDDVMTLSSAAHLLVDQAINNPNFRYTGARLCYHLEESCPTFRAELHLRCKKELSTNPNKQNVLLFIAELYTQLHHQNIYGDLVIDSFKQLLSEGGNANIKCICQALKLTGYSLEKYNKDALNDIFKQLQAVKATVKDSALILLKSVLELRQQQWGHCYSNEANNSSNDEDGYYYEDPQSTIFYNAEGHAFSNEESQFLAANMNSNDDYLSDTSDPDELCDPEPEMDEEIQEAFKEFVKLSKNS